ncbi:MAG: 50S ribosomal protein L1 [Candidatus Micrarchaeia archaeon]
MLEDKYADFEKFLQENKGKRKFRQTVELAINFKGRDFTNQSNRLNFTVLLPNGKGKSSKLAVFASDKNIIDEAKRNNIEVISDSDIPTIAADKQRLASLLNYELLAQPSLMPTIARYLGQFLGPRGKMPRPLLPGTSMQRAAAEANAQITIKNTGKFLPTIHCAVGTEDMDPKKLFENIKAVVDSIAEKVRKDNIKSIYVKLTMSKAQRLL